MMRVVAIDGPSGSGKSTVSRALAERLGLEVLDTGAMYRAVTLAVLDAGISIDDGPAAAALASSASIDVDARVRLNGRDVTDEIRGPAVTAAVSAVSAHPEVRTVLVAAQREWAAARGGGVVEGRDLGTVGFPDAPLKVYLTASDAERARRRHGDETAAARATEVSDVAADLARRDELDRTRAASPLAAAPDALTIDSTTRAVADIVDELAKLAEERFAESTERG